LLGGDDAGEDANFVESSRRDMCADMCVYIYICIHVCVGERCAFKIFWWDHRLKYEREINT
jgi:hypothetical protein